MSEKSTSLEALGKLARLLSELGEESDLPAGSVLTELVGHIHPSDLGDLISAAPSVAQFPLFRAIPEDEDAAEVLALLDEGVRENLLEELSLDRKAKLVSELSPDDAADVVAQLPRDEQDRVLARLDAEDAAEVRELAAYAPDSAGGLMTTEYVAVRNDQTVRAALMQVKTSSEDWEEVREVFAVDGEGRLTGVVELNDLLRAKLSQPLSEVLEEVPVAVSVSDDQEEAAQKAAHYRVLTLPVVDENDKLVGAISYDDLMEALGDEASEDMFRLAGSLETHPTREGLFERLLHRFPFLLVTILGTYFVAMVIKEFPGGLTRDAGILAYLPMIAALAGNAGIQTATMMIRGFATGDVQASQFRTILGRETCLAVLTGVCAGLVEFLLLYPFEQDRTLVTIVPVAQFLAVVLATIVGTGIPFLCLKMRFKIGGREISIDPALAAGPFITTLNDIIATALALALSLLLHRS